MSLKKQYIPLFEDELEMDEVLDSIAWDLCGLARTSAGRWPAAGQRFQSCFGPRTGKPPRKPAAKR